METSAWVVGHRNPDTDSVGSAIAYAWLKRKLGDARFQPARAGEVDAETDLVLRAFDVPLPTLLTDAAGLELVLVDHNEVAQALPHIEQATIVEIWEHHRLGDLHPATPIVFHCEPVGATATLIGEHFFVRGVSPPAPMAGLLLASILSDTSNFRSPTTSEQDRVMAKRLSSLSGVDPVRFGEEMLQLKAAAAERKSAARVVRDDFKAFPLGREVVGIAQVEVTRPGVFDARKAEILEELRAVQQAGDYFHVLLVITNVSAGDSDLWFVGKGRDVVEDAFGPLVDSAVHVPGCMSRKKQVVPRLEASFARHAEHRRGPSADSWE